MLTDLEAELLDMVEMLADGLQWNLESLDVMGESDREALTEARALIARVKRARPLPMNGTDSHAYGEE